MRKGPKKWVRISGIITIQEECAAILAGMLARDNEGIGTYEDYMEAGRKALEELRKPRPRRTP